MIGPGEIIAERWRTIWGSDRIHIARADPKAMISAEALLQIQADPHPDVSINGDVLTINADNGRWIYRIGEYDAATDAYQMEWPD